MWPVLYKIALIYLVIITSCNTSNATVRECCSDGQQLNLDNLKCVAKKDPNAAPKLNIIGRNLIHGRECTSNKTAILLNPENGSEEQFSLNNGGILTWDGVQYPFTDYCVDVMEGVAIVCDYGIDEEELMSVIGMIISMPFLLATLVVYGLLPDLNLHMKALMFYVFSLLMGYVFLVSIQLSSDELAPTPCLTLALVTNFFFIASFLWMNVICIDIWFTFSGLRGFQGSKRSSERKRLLLYCAYAWGLTIFHTVTVLLINTYGDDKSWYHPKINTSRCWYENDWASIYFYGPMAALIIANVFLFGSTAYKIKKSQNETKMLRKDDSQRHSAENDKQKFYLYLKLFLAMGVNWSLELISWLVEWHYPGAKYLFYITDFCNAIYGLVIFILFVFKKKIWLLLKKRYYKFIGKPFMAQETTRRTQSSHFSATESTMFSDTENPNNETRPIRMNSYN